jgi:hypothetical protein
MIRYQKVPTEATGRFPSFLRTSDRNLSQGVSAAKPETGCFLLKINQSLVIFKIWLNIRELFQLSR